MEQEKSEKKDEKPKDKKKKYKNKIVINPNLDEALDEGLSLAQRRQRSIKARANKAKLKRGREIAARRRPSEDTLKKRAVKTARDQMKDVLSKGKDFNELSPAQKQKIEDRLKSPALQRKIQMIVRKEIKKKRQAL